jgi:hypothetical protein
LRELVVVFLEQYQGAPASRDWLRHYLVKSIDCFGDILISELDALVVSRWRAGMPGTMRHGAHRALRQVLAAAVVSVDRSQRRDGCRQPDARANGVQAV